MARRNIGTLWDRDNRNNMNQNFIELYKQYEDYFDKVTDDLREHLMESAYIHFKGHVETESELPSSGENGDTYFVTSTGEWQRWNGNKFEAIAETDPSEFIALRDDFGELESDVDDFKTLLMYSFDKFKDDVNADIDDKIGDIDAQVQSFIDGIQEQIIYVEEEGENSNGKYIRYSDGTMKCWSPVFETTTENKTGNIYRSESVLWEYPKEFVGIPSITSNTAYTSRWSETSGTPREHSVSVRVFSSTESSSEGSLVISADGWWK